MTLSEEIYFEITLTGVKSALKKFISALKAGEMDDFFEIAPDYIIFEDDYNAASDDEKCSFVLSNDDLPVEIDEMNPEDFLDVFCKAGKDLEISGHFYDMDDEEYRFSSPAGSADYMNTLNVDRFNDELDEEAYQEEKEERD